MRSVSTAEAVEGRGLLGDRYERKAGTFSRPGGRGYELTLVEAEALEELSAKGVELSPIEARRNIVVRGIALDDLWTPILSTVVCNKRFLRRRGCAWSLGFHPLDPLRPPLRSLERLG